MKWGTFWATSTIIMVIIFFQRSLLKKSPKKDMFACIGLFLIGLILSLFDLPDVGGPINWIEILFKPLAAFMEK